MKALAAELAKGIKTEKDLGKLTPQLVKMTVETALNAEFDDHLGYDKHAPAGRGSGNIRNDTTLKWLKGQHGEVDIDAPRHRSGSFDPQFLCKLSGMLRVQFRGICEAKMLECMNRRGRDIEIVMHKRSRARVTRRTSVVFAC